MHSASSVGIVGFDFQPGVRQFVGFRDRIEEFLPDHRIRHQFPAIDDFVVIGEEIGFENLEAIQFGKQVSGALYRQNQRLLRVQLTLAIENLMRAFEIEIVEILISGLQSCLGIHRRPHLRTSRPAGGGNQRKKSDESERKIGRFDRVQDAQAHLVFSTDGRTARFQPLQPKDVSNGTPRRSSGTFQRSLAKPFSVA